MVEARKPRLSMAGREPTAAERAAPEKLAQLVIRKVLQRIGEEPDLAFHLGAGTETLHLLLIVDAAFSGRSSFEGEEKLLEAWATLKRRPARDLLDELVAAGDRTLISFNNIDEDGFYKEERGALKKALNAARDR